MGGAAMAQFALSMKDQFMNTHMRIGALETFVGNMGQNVAGDINHLNMQLTARLLVAEKVRFRRLSN